MLNVIHFFSEPSTPKPVKREQNMETSSPPEPKRSKLSSSQAFDLIRQNLTKALVDQVQEVEQQKDFHSKELVSKKFGRFAGLIQAKAVQSCLFL